MPSLLDLPNELITHIAECLVSIAVKQYPYLLCWAADSGYVDLVRRLLHAGADPNMAFIAEYMHPPGYEHNRWLLGSSCIPAKMALNSIYCHESHSAALTTTTDEPWLGGEDELSESEGESDKGLSVPVPWDAHRTGGEDLLRPSSTSTPYWFPLHAVARSGHKSTVQLLFDSGASLNPASFLFPQYHRIWGAPISLPTPLQSALNGRKDSTASLLLSLGASINVDLAETQKGRSALHVAAMNDFSLLFSFLWKAFTTCM
ncbi:Uu.00g088780.m01.CDS01 [Anthostomella pinea]|uniref:Uu.00g088780.m01.CDS01 n=1 Tax=Anthostomella pinea TaxID=933095 RepID=A0AAI8VN87_9PEZI|nr:Uu.00g088780.m01.CDS01 [Anthostomella pinea]